MLLTSEVLLLGKEQEVIKTGSGLCVAITLLHKLNLPFKDELLMPLQLQLATHLLASLSGQSDSSEAC